MEYDIFYLILRSTEVKSLLITTILELRKALTKFILIFSPPDNCFEVMVEN